MADNVNSELLTTIRLVLISVRRSLELRLTARTQSESPDSAVLKDFLLAVESARLTFMAADRRPPHQASFDSVEPHLVATIRELNGIMAEERYTPILKRAFRMGFSAGTRDQSPKGLMPGFEGKEMSIGDALSRLLEYASEYGPPPSSSPAVRDLFELRSIVPKQKIAPAQFEVKESRVVIARRTSPHDEDDKNNIASAKAELQRNNQRIIQELERSNCDRRLLENVQELQKLLNDDTDAIKIGLANLGCEVMSAAFEHELPTAVASMLKSHTRGVNLFVGQFPEWNKFLENAASVHIEASDVGAIKTASDTVIAELRGRPDLIDPEVPRTLSHLNELLRTPSAAGKRAAFAVLRSVENLISVIYTFGAEFAEKLASKTVDHASTVASKLLVRSLLALALAGAASIGPFAGKVSEMKWLQTASEIVKKQIQKLADE
ncbi:MAG: hypothetical protein WCE79_09515 [Xanthobacteraceae bacterium]